MTVTRLFQFGALLAALCLPSVALAAPFMNITFDGDTIGNQPATSTDDHRSNHQAVGHRRLHGDDIRQSPDAGQRRLGRRQRG